MLIRPARPRAIRDQLAALADLATDGHVPAGQYDRALALVLAGHAATDAARLTGGTPPCTLGSDQRGSHPRRRSPR